MKTLFLKFEKMRKLIPIFILLSLSTNAQPYLDLGQIFYHNSPGGEPKEFQHFRAQVNVPIVFKDSSVFLFNPVWEERWMKISETSDDQHYRGFITWLSFAKRLGTKWEVMAAFIPRFNGAPEVQFKEGFQAGGALLFTYKKRSNLAFKFGGYYNTEFFGPFFWPLLGIDWKISQKQRLFATLPSFATYEYRINKKLSWGGNFRTFTNSYKMYNTPAQTFKTDYTRFEDNQLGAYMDLYFTSKIVATAEGGYSIMRKITAGQTKNSEPIILSKHDGLYARVAIQYRLRFD